jgi:hypothetical protein
MKKIILVAIFAIFLNQRTYAQSGIDALSVNYSVENTLGFEVTLLINTNTITKYKHFCGIGASFNLASYGNGENYTDNRYSFTTKYKDQKLISQDKDKKNASLYAVVGVKNKIMRATAKLGYGNEITYNNYYDPSKIFGDKGYYYRKVESESDIFKGDILIGTSLGVKIHKNIYIDAGVDNFNGATLGLTYVF